MKEELNVTLTKERNRLKKTISKYGRKVSSCRIGPSIDFYRIHSKLATLAALKDDISAINMQPYEENLAAYREYIGESNFKTYLKFNFKTVAFFSYIF